jgi:hypothetical protein
MASKRELKKRVKRLTEVFVADAVVMSEMYPEKSEEINKMIEEVLEKRNKMLHVINHPPMKGVRLKKQERYEKRKEAKAAYKQNLKENVNELIKTIDANYQQIGDFLKSNE